MNRIFCMKVVGVVAAGLFSAGLVFSGVSGMAATTAPTGAVLDLAGYQTPEEGIVTTFKGGNSADPYFGLYVLELARRGGLDVSEAASAFITWGLSQQKPDGRFERYCKRDHLWERCGRADSDDATLARWVHLLYQEGGAQMPATWKESADKAEAALEALKMANGIYSVFPHDTPGLKGYALFKDNIEVLSVQEALSAHFRKLGDTERAEQYLARAQALRTAMARHFGKEPYAMKRLALGANYDRERFYPHAVSVPFGWMEGYYPAPDAEDWADWLGRYQKDWDANAAADFPWGLMALAALHTGNREVAACWYQRYTPWRDRNYRWNVLEEAAWQIIGAHEPGTPADCPAAPTGSASAAEPEAGVKKSRRFLFF